MGSNFSTGPARWLQVILRGVAQVAFADRPLAGVLVLAGTAAVAPWSALGAFIGALVGTVAGRLHRAFTEPEWEMGLAGPNPAIVGILWGGVFGSGAVDGAFFVLALLGCIGIEQAARPALAKVHLPVLSAPAMATAYLVLAAYSAFGATFWNDSGLLPLGEAGIGIAIVLIVAAMASKSAHATLQTVIIAAAVAVSSGWLMEGRVLGPVGLWGFAAAPAAFGMHAIFLAGSATGSRMGLLAAVLAVVIWLFWMASPLVGLAPPLLIPFVVAVWAFIALARRVYGTLVVEPAFWVAADAIRRARRQDKSVVALTGAGISTDSGIPDYVSGSWLQPGVPVSAYSYERFLASAQCRRAYWDACDTFRRAVEDARPNPGHFALARMEQAGWLAATITQNVDNLHQEAGSRKVVALHGCIDHVRCLGCGRKEDWPPAAPWRTYDLHCSDCSGLIKPAVIAMGENVPPTAWRAAERAAGDCGVMIVVGSQIAVSSAHALLAQARRGGAAVIIVALDHTGSYAGPDDVVLRYKAEAALSALALLLDCPIAETPGSVRRRKAAAALKASAPRLSPAATPSFAAPDTAPSPSPGPSPAAP